MRRLSVLLVLVSALTMACNKEVTDPEEQEPPETGTVQATPTRQFLPPDREIRVGGTVTWEAQSLAHNVTFEAAEGVPQNIDLLAANSSDSRVFPVAGTFTYRCTIHPEMIATISVIAP